MTKLNRPKSVLAPAVLAVVFAALPSLTSREAVAQTTPYERCLAATQSYCSRVWEEEGYPSYEVCFAVESANC